MNRNDSNDKKYASIKDESTQQTQGNNEQHYWQNSLPPSFQQNYIQTSNNIYLMDFCSYFLKRSKKYQQEANKTFNQQVVEDLGMKRQIPSTDSFSAINNNLNNGIMKTEEDQEKLISDLLLKYTKQTTRQMQDQPSSSCERNRLVSPHSSPQKFKIQQNLSPSMKLRLGLKLKDIQQRQLLKDQNAIYKGQNKTDFPRQNSYERSNQFFDSQDPKVLGSTIANSGLIEQKSRLQNELNNILPQNQSVKLSSVLEMKETLCENNVSPYIYQAAEGPSQTSLRLLHGGVEENKREVQTPQHETTNQMIRFYSSEQTFNNLSIHENNFESISNPISRTDINNIQKNPQNIPLVNLATNTINSNSAHRSGGNLENFQRFATRNIKNQFHNHNNLSEQSSPYAVCSPSGKKTKNINLGIPREIPNLFTKIDSKMEQQNNEKRGRTIEEKYAKSQNNGLRKEGHNNSELDLIQERRKIQMEVPSQLQQTASSQNDQPNITEQSDTILPSYRQPKNMSNSFWNLQRLHIFVKENKNYSITELNKIDHGKMILTYQESFSDQTFFKSLTLMYYQHLFLKDPQIGKSPQLSLFDLLNFVNNNQIILHSVPLKDIQGDQLKEIFIKNVNELANLRNTLSCEALFEKFLQIFTQDPFFCEALIQVTKQSVALTCESCFKEQAASFLQIASQNWFDIKTEFFPLLSNAFNSVIEMHYLLDNQIEISTFQSLRVQTVQTQTLSFVYYYNQTLKKQFYFPLFSLEDSLIFGALSSFVRYSPSTNFLSQLTQNSSLSKSESLKRLNDTTNQNEMKEHQQKGNVVPQSITNNISFRQKETPEINQQAVEYPSFNNYETQAKINENYQGKERSITLNNNNNQDTSQKIIQTQNLQLQQLELNYQYSLPKSPSPLNTQNLIQRDTTENQLPPSIISQKTVDINPSNYSQKDNFVAIQQEKEEQKELITIKSPPMKVYSNLEQIPQHQFNSKFLTTKIQLLMQICKENTQTIEKTLQLQDEKIIQPGSPVIHNSKQERKPQPYLNLADILNVETNNNPQNNLMNNDIQHRNRGNSAPRAQHYTSPIISEASHNRTGSPPPTFKSKQQHQLIGQSSNSYKNLPSLLTTPAKWQSPYQKFEDAVMSSPLHQKDLISRQKQNTFQGQAGINQISSVSNNLNTAPQFKNIQSQQKLLQNTQNQIGYNLPFGNITSANKYPLQKHASLLQVQYPMSNNYNPQSAQQQPNTQIPSLNQQLSNKPQTINPQIMLSEQKQIVQQFGYQSQQQYLGSQSQKNLFVRRNY